MSELGGGCPCTLIKPCSKNCTCANPVLSGGCSRCCRYGSLEQRTAQAQRLSVKEGDPWIDRDGNPHRTIPGQVTARDHCMASLDEDEPIQRNKMMMRITGPSTYVNSKYTRKEDDARYKEYEKNCKCSLCKLRRMESDE